jgi:hypothetical protein
MVQAERCYRQVIEREPHKLLARYRLAVLLSHDPEQAAIV